MTRLRADSLRLGYDGDPVVHDLSLEVPEGQVTVICGPNACGKSTLLRAMARLLKPRHGAVYLDGAAIARMPTKQVASRLGLLPQAPTAPDGLSVEDLVGRGRGPVKSSVYEGSESWLVSSSSVTRTGSSQWGQGPPGPSSRLNRLQSSQRRWAWRSPQSEHS